MARTEEPTTKSKVIKAILTSLSLGGFMAVAVVAPNAVQMLGPLFRKPGRGLHNRRYYVKSTLSRLADRGLVVFKKNKNGKIYAKLTDRGHGELMRYKLEDLVINKPRRWDGKWRIVIFDIKELRRRERNQMRRELINLGFQHLQHSVWVYPYECDEFVTLLKTYYSLGRSLLYLIVDKLEDDRQLREMFELEN